MGAFPSPYTLPLWEAQEKSENQAKAKTKALNPERLPEAHLRICKSKKNKLYFCVKEIKKKKRKEK